MEKREVSGFMIFALSFAIDGSPMICLISSSNRCLNGETTMHYFKVMSEPLVLILFFNVLGRKLLSGNLESLYLKCQEV